jgi:hypothetical protein
MERVKHYGLGVEFPGQPLDVFYKFRQNLASTCHVLSLYLIEDSNSSFACSLLLLIGHLWQYLLKGLESFE